MCIRDRLKTAKVIAAEEIKRAKKLLKLTVKCGEETRTIVSGIKESFTAEEMVGKTVILSLIHIWQRRRELERIAENPFTSVLYESPHQLKKTLADLAALIPERRAAICKEMTKIYESICRGTVAELEQAFAQGRCV